MNVNFKLAGIYILMLAKVFRVAVAREAIP